MTEKVVDPEVEQFFADLNTQKPVEDREELYPHFMTPERIMGVLIYAVLRGEVNDEVIKLARSVPLEHYLTLAEDEREWWNDVPTFIFTADEPPLDERGLAYHQRMLKSEIVGILRWRAAGRPERADQ
jgi:hypothetical protein